MRVLSLLVAIGLAMTPTVALAGMPSVSFSITDAAKMRIDAISFFLALFFLSALGTKFLWNLLARDFTLLPRLTYRKALALTTLWGLLFVLVLTMISGARELMTPGAWEKNGTTYSLRESASAGENR